MRALIITAGSTGDVVPYTGLAARLAASGHDVAIATHQRFAGLVAASGVGFRLLRGDPGVLLGQVEDGGDGETPAFEDGRAALARNVKVAAAVTRDFAHHIAAAVRDGGADVLLLGATVAPLAWHVGEGLGIPSVGVYVQPAHPTRAFAPPFVTSRSFGGRGNRTVGRATEALIDRWIAPATRSLRSELGLPPLSPRSLRRRLEDERWPVCYGFSPAVVPRPADWRPGLDVVGYWWPHHLPGWRPPADLVEFLAAGPPPVFVSFGSGGRDQAERLDTVVRSAVGRAGVRAIVQAGWAGLGTPGGVRAAGDGVAGETNPPGRARGAGGGVAGETGPPGRARGAGGGGGLGVRIDGDGDVLIVDGHVAHDWLLPQVAAVVHHGGAGTTAATLRAGVPSIPVPLGVDSGFWAGRLDALGVSPGLVPLKGRAAADRLAAAVQRAVTEPGYRERARALAGQIAEEDGAGAVLDTLARAVVV